MQGELTVNKGDSIEIKAQGMTVRGIVATHDHWGDSGWQIEIDKANVPGGYSAWKQWADGGRITMLRGKQV